MYIALHPCAPGVIMHSYPFYFHPRVAHLLRVNMFFPSTFVLSRAEKDTHPPTCHCDATCAAYSPWMPARQTFDAVDRIALLAYLDRSGHVIAFERQKDFSVVPELQDNHLEAYREICKAHLSTLAMFSSV